MEGVAYIVLILTLDLLGGQVAHRQYYFNIRFIGREIGREVAYIFLILTSNIRFIRLEREMANMEVLILTFTQSGVTRTHSSNCSITVDLTMGLYPELTLFCVIYYIKMLYCTSYTTPAK